MMMEKFLQKERLSRVDWRKFIKDEFQKERDMIKGTLNNYTSYDTRRVSISKQLNFGCNSLDLVEY